MCLLDLVYILYRRNTAFYIILAQALKPLTSLWPPNSPKTCNLGWVLNKTYKHEKLLWTKLNINPYIAPPPHTIKTNESVANISFTDPPRSNSCQHTIKGVRGFPKKHVWCEFSQNRSITIVQVNVNLIFLLSRVKVISTRMTLLIYYPKLFNNEKAYITFSI